MSTNFLLSFLMGGNKYSTIGNIEKPEIINTDGRRGIIISH
jgi:hypothetical protein